MNWLEEIVRRSALAVCAYAWHSYRTGKKFPCDNDSHKQEEALADSIISELERKIDGLRKEADKDRIDDDGHIGYIAGHNNAIHQAKSIIRGE